ncbi:hypothetical protein PRCB_17710 [Pantoea rodasii]|uniref:Uncharacterized protein n=1 Tax=Pantoea rodasii TaxID=1076549 RepID=A0A2M9W9B1_9GAMM|nr:hypothetical protein PRCB_17710 [Pantoea rodasii]
METFGVTDMFRPGSCTRQVQLLVDGEVSKKKFISFQVRVASMKTFITLRYWKELTVSGVWLFVHQRLC